MAELEELPSGDPDEIFVERVNYLLDYHGRDAEHSHCAECGLRAAIEAIAISPIKK